MTTDEQRDIVIAQAKDWLGTPFVNGAMVKGHGVDCAHLLVAAFAGFVSVDVPKYPPDWFLNETRERLKDIVEQFCQKVESPAVGDIALFRFGRALSHGGIVLAVEPELAMIHAYRPTKGVQVDAIGSGSGFATRLGGFWRLNAWV